MGTDLPKTLTITDITTFQEMQWTGHGCTIHAGCDVHYSCHATMHKFSAGFVIDQKLRDLVSRFTPMGERIETIHIKAKFHHINIICAHALTEEEDDETKEQFYRRLEEVYEKCPPRC